MMTLIQEDALAVQITPVQQSAFSGAHSLDLDKYPTYQRRCQINMFFFMIPFLLEARNEAGDIQSMTTPEIEHPGLQFHGKWIDEVIFKSNFYDRLTIPITITEEMAQPYTNLTVIRTGIEFEHFIRSRSDPNSLQQMLDTAHAWQRNQFTGR
jgi:hypothetical protein